MGIYLNPDSSKFEEAVNSAIYIDKTGLLTYTNSVLHTMQKYICISRPRRFGKSITANMIAAYYNCEADSKELFSRFKIASCESFEKYLNKQTGNCLKRTFPVLFLQISQKFNDF